MTMADMEAEEELDEEEEEPKIQYDEWAIVIKEIEEEKRENNPVLNRNKEKCIIRQGSSLIVRWDLFVMFLATWNCFSIPLEIGIRPKMAESILWIAFNHLIDLFFVGDIFITFRTSIVSKEKK